MARDHLFELKCKILEPGITSSNNCLTSKIEARGLSILIRMASGILFLLLSICICNPIPCYFK